MESKIIEDVQSLAALEEQWRALQPAIMHPYQELGWYVACARTLATTGGRRLKVITAWDGDRLTAVMPLVLRRFKGVRLLEWVGARVSDYSDIIVRPGVDPGEASRTLWRGLWQGVRFDVLRLGQVRADALINGPVDSANHRVETEEASFGIPLRWSSGDDYIASRNSHRRGRLRQSLRQISKHGYEFKVWRTYEPAVLDAAIEQKQGWARARGVPSFITESEGPAFVHAMAQELAASGSLHLSAIQSAERIVAVHVGFIRNDTLYYYMPTYDAAFAKLGFGSSLRESLLMWACDQGLKKFDLLLGAEEYKQQYETLDQPVRTLLVPRGIIGRIAVAYYRRGAAPKPAVVSGESPEPA